MNQWGLPCLVNACTCNDGDGHSKDPDGQRGRSSLVTEVTLRDPLPSLYP